MLFYWQEFRVTPKTTAKPETTTDSKQLLAAIDNLTTSRGTVIGAATLKALDALAAVNPDIAPVGTDTTGTAGTGTGAPAAPSDPSAAATPATPPPGGYEPDIVVLLTDGANTRGIDPIEAAQQAAARRVRVYTIGFGTTTPAPMVCTRAQLGGGALGGDGFGGGPPPDVGGAGGAGGGRRSFLLTDEPTLMKVAEITGGSFYRAQDAGQLRDVFAKLPKQIELQTRHQEISVAFAALGFLLAAAAVGLSLWWNRSP